MIFQRRFMTRRSFPFRKKLITDSKILKFDAQRGWLNTPFANYLTDICLDIQIKLLRQICTAEVVSEMLPFVSEWEAQFALLSFLQFRL